MSGKQLTVLWGGFVFYGVCVLWEAVSWASIFSFPKAFSDSFHKSGAYGAIILILTILLCLTVGWFEKRQPQTAPNKRDVDGKTF